MPELAVQLRALIAEGTDRLRQSGAPEPRRQALRIWTDLNQVDPTEAVIHGNVEVQYPAVRRFRRAIERRASGEPLPHVTGWVGFRRLSLRVDQRVLIPRPETEGLVDLLLPRTSTGRLADVGTGSGCLALSLAQEGNFTHVVAVDWSAEALAVARVNRDLAGGPVEFLQSDLCSALRPGAFDALVSNPPYLTVAEYAGLDPSVRNWEPRLALVSGEDGFSATARLLTQGRDVLRAGGWLALEVDCNRAAAAAHFAAALGWEEVQIHMDLFGRERYLLARRSNAR